MTHMDCSAQREKQEIKTQTKWIYSGWERASAQHRLPFLLHHSPFVLYTLYAKVRVITMTLCVGGAAQNIRLPWQVYSCAMNRRLPFYEYIFEWRKCTCTSATVARHDTTLFGLQLFSRFHKTCLLASTISFIARHIHSNNRRTATTNCS